MNASLILTEPGVKFYERFINHTKVSPTVKIKKIEGNDDNNIIPNILFSAEISSSN